MSSFYDYNTGCIEHYRGTITHIDYTDDTGTIFVSNRINGPKHVHFKPSKVLYHKKDTKEDIPNEINDDVEDKKEVEVEEKKAIEEQEIVEEERMESLSEGEEEEKEKEEEHKDENDKIEDNVYTEIKLKESDIISFDIFNDSIQHIKLEEFGHNHQPEEMLHFLSLMGKGDFIALIYQELCVAVSRFMEYNLVRLPVSEQQKCIEDIIDFYINTIASSSSLQVQIWVPILTEEIPDFARCLNSFLQNEDISGEWKKEHYDKLKKLSTYMFKTRPCEELITLFSFLKTDNERKDFIDILDAIASACEYDYKYDPTISIPWDMLPLTPTQNELTGNDLFSEPPMGSDSYLDILPEIKYNCPYKDTTEYLETNFRLFRTDCFSNISKGVRVAMKGINSETKLSRTPLYRNVSITVAPISHDSKPNNYTSISYLVTCIPAYQCILDKNLTLDNVLAISPSGKFDDVIWARVTDTDEISIQAANKELSRTNRVKKVGDVKTKIKFEISLLTEANGGPKREIEIIRTLLLKSDPKHTLIAENPVLYLSYKSALDVIKNIKPDTLPFKNELVYCRHDPVVDPEEVETLKKLVLEDDRFKTFDDGQRDAFTYFAENSFSIIQGPPGTGKSYLGSRIAIALGEVCKYKKILVMSYKNHSLDEFIIDIAKLLSNSANATNEIVRFGRSPKRDPRVVKYSIEALLDTVLSGDEALKDPNLATLNHARVKISSEINSICRDVSLLCLALKTSDVSYAQFKSVFGKKETEEFFSEKKFRGIKRPEDRYKMWIGSSKESFKKSFSSKNDEDIPDYLNEEDNDDDGEDFDESQSDYEDYDEKLIKEGRGKKLDYKGDMERNPSKFVDTQSLKNPEILLQKINGNKKRVILDDDASPDECLLYAMRVVYKKNIDTLLELLERYRRVMLIKENLLAERQSYIIQNTRYICCTITGGSRFHDMIDRVKPEAVIIEEAAEIPEPALLAALYHPSLKRVVMIGDHEQLRPGLETIELRRKNLNISCFERLCENGYPYSMLNIQNRMVDPVLWPVGMHYETKKLMTNALVNEGRFFENENEAKAYEFIRSQPVYWWANPYPDAKSANSKSYYNVKDAEMVEILVKNLVVGGFEQKSITVLTPYLSQVGYIGSTLRKDFPNVKVATIDSFQGDENKIIILSLVRSHEFTREELDGKVDEANTRQLPFSKRKHKENYIGFMSEKNRLIVATSRHKLALYIIGNEITYHEHKDWAKLIDEFRMRGALGDSLKFMCPHHKQQYKISSEVKGCGRTCGMVMPGCQHRCKTTCHFLISSDHHPPCRENVDVHLECGHSVSVYCYNSSNVKCTVKKKIVLDCGHETVVHCMGKFPEQYTEPEPCMEKCKHVYKKCGHECIRSCCHFKSDGTATHSEDDCFICVVKTRPVNIIDVKLDSKKLATDDQISYLERLVPDKRFKKIIPSAKNILRMENINIEVSSLYIKLINLIAKENGLDLPEKYKSVPNIWYFMMLSHLLDKKTLIVFFDTFCNIMEGCSYKNFEEYYKGISDGIKTLESRMWEWTKTQDSFKHLLTSPLDSLITEITIGLDAQYLLSGTEDEDNIREIWSMNRLRNIKMSSFNGSFNSPPSEEIQYFSPYREEYVGCMMMSVRLKDPVFTVLRYCAPRVVMYCSKWESFIAKFVSQEKRLNPFLVPRGYENFVSMKKAMFDCIAPMRVRVLQSHIMRLVSRAIVKRCSVRNSFITENINSIFLASPYELIIVCNSSRRNSYREVYRAVFESIDIFLQKLRSSLTYDFFFLRSMKLEGLGPVEGDAKLPPCMKGFEEVPIDEEWAKMAEIPKRDSPENIFFYREMLKDGINDYYGDGSLYKRPIIFEQGISNERIVDAMFKVLEFDVDERVCNARLQEDEDSDSTEESESVNYKERNDGQAAEYKIKWKKKGKGKGNKGGKKDDKKGGGNKKVDKKGGNKKVDKKGGGGNKKGKK